MSDLERRWRNRISLAFLSFSAVLCLVAGYWLAVKDASEAAERRFATQYAAILELSPSGLLIADEDGIIKAANKHAAGLLGRSNVVGSHIHDFCTPEIRVVADAAFQRAIDKLKQGGETRLSQTDCMLVNAYGIECPVQIQVRALPDKDGPLVVASITPLSKLSRVNMLPRTPTPLEHISTEFPLDAGR